METISKLIPSVDKNITFRLLAEDKFHPLLVKLKRIFLYQVKDKNLKNEFDVICKELNKITLQRNDFIHAVFLTIGEKEIRRFKLKPDIHIAPAIFEEKQVKIRDITGFIDQITKAKESLSNLNKKIITLTPKQKTYNALSTLSKDPK